MSVSSISSNAAQSLQQNTPNASFQQAFQQLTSAINSGNLQAAQTAYSGLQSLPQPQGPGQSDSSSSSQNPLSQFLSQVGSSLSSGDISSAQSDLQTLQSQGPHHHRGGHWGGGPGGPGASGATGASSTSSSSTSASTNQVDVTA